MADNYKIQLENAKQLYLNHDRKAIARRLSLKSDADALFIDFLGENCRIDNRTGAVYYTESGQELGFKAAMSIYDYICRSTPLPRSGGSKAPINSIQRNHPGVGENSYYKRFTEKFDADREGFSEACIALGGKAYPRGDAAFTFTVFEGLELTLQLWYSDEEFGANLTPLWDDHVLGLLMYESAWYVCGYLLDCISAKMDELKARS